MYGKTTIPLGFLGVLGIFLLFTFLNSPNILVSIPVMVYPLFIYRLFWIKTQPNILFWGLFFQWLNVSIQLIYCNIKGITLEQYMQGTAFPAELMNYTEYLSIAAIYFYALGIFFAVRKLKNPLIDDILSAYNPYKVLRTYILVELIVDTFQGLIWNYPGLVTYFFFLFYIKWGFFLITFYVLNKKGGDFKIAIYLIVAFQFFLALSSYFSSSFLNILFFLFIGFFTISQKMDIKRLIFLPILCGLIFHVAILWQASKGEYRSFLTGGEAIQSVTVSDEQARTKLFWLVSRVDKDAYNNAIETTIDRLGYIQYFAACLDYVPRVVPHEDGNIYLSAIQFYLSPRLLFPEKEILDDSKHTNQYTGLGVSGIKEGVSFSLGSVADAYIDFGSFYMMVPIFLFGLLVGGFFAFISRKSPNALWAWILTAPFFLLITIYGTDTKKALGAILIYSLTVILLRRILIKIFDPMMRA